MNTKVIRMWYVEQHRTIGCLIKSSCWPHFLADFGFTAVYLHTGMMSSKGQHGGQERGPRPGQQNGSHGFKVKVFSQTQQQNKPRPQQQSSPGKREDQSLKRSVSDTNGNSSNKRRKIEFVPPNNPKNAFGTLPNSTSQHEASTNGHSSVMKKPQNGTLVPKKLASSGLFSPEVVSRYLHWHQVQRVGPGFFNEGNSCYLNSTLQCLMYIPALVQVLMRESEEALKNIPKHTGHHMKPIAEIFTSLVHEIWGEASNTSRKAILPRGMVTTIRRVGKQFKAFRQEDAHEYLRQLLDCMHEEVLKANHLKTSDGKPAETTFVSRIFGGYLCNTLTCSQCGYASKTFNHFLDLSLEIRQGIQSLQGAIEGFTKPEQLSHGNEWTCDGCKRKVKATKQMTISEAPAVLVVHLKRFAFGGGFSLFSQGNAKITKHIQFPLAFSLPCGGKSKKDYELSGVVVHHGSTTHSGHYIAYVKVSKSPEHRSNYPECQSGHSFTFLRSVVFQRYLVRDE